MRNKYKNLQNRPQSKIDNSYITSEKINHLNNPSKYNNINKNSFISNFDNKEKVEKIMNQINDKDKKPLIEKRYAASFISNDKTTTLRSSNHNILYSVYKKEKKENINKPDKETNLINTNNTNNKIDYFSSRYYNTNKNSKLNVVNNKENKENKIIKERQSLRTENLRESYTKRINTINDNNNSRNKNDNKNYNRNNRSIKANNLETNFNNSRNNNISINNKREKSVGGKKDYDYKKIKWDIKEHRLKINDKKETTNYNSTTNILLSNKNKINKIENKITDNNIINKRSNYINNLRQKEKEKENKQVKKLEEKDYNSNRQSKNDIFSDKIKKKFTYRSKRSSGEEEVEIKKEEKNDEKIKNINKNENKINDNLRQSIKRKDTDIKKYDNEKKENEKNNKGKTKYINELIKTPNVTNIESEGTNPKTEDTIAKKKYRRYFYFRANKNKDNNDKEETNKNEEKKDEKKENNNDDNKDIKNNNDIKIEQNNNDNKEEINKEDSNNNEINKDNDNYNDKKYRTNQNTEKKNPNNFSPIVSLSPIPKISTEVDVSPELNVESPQSQGNFKRINTYMYKINRKHSFKDLIHEVNLNKDFHNSFANIFQSCRNDINTKNTSQDLNKSISSFSNANGDLKLNLDISQGLKINLKGQKSSDINNYYNYNNPNKIIKAFSPNSNLIYKKKMNLIKTISNQYKKSLPNFIFNSINNLNNISNKRNSNDLSYGNIINNNTYNTTLNIFTEKHPEKKLNILDINNISKIEDKKHLRTNSEMPPNNNKQHFYQIFNTNTNNDNLKEKEKEKTINLKNNLNKNDISTIGTHKKNKSISTTIDLSELININNNTSNISSNNSDIKYLISLEILYIVESKLQNILSKINIYMICPNECFDLITYYFSSKFYQKVINIFKSEQNQKNISQYIKLELLCYFLCYDVCFNKSFSQTGILLKTIFNLLHNNYLIIVNYVINEAEKAFDHNAIKNEISIKLKNVIKNNLKIKFPNQNLDENIIINLIGNNLKQVTNYYKMLIDNLYSHFYMKKNSKKNYSDVKYKFPNCLQLDIDNLDYYEKINIISLFFYDAFNRIFNHHNFEDMKYFFDSFLQRMKYNKLKESLKPKSKSKNKQNKLLSASNTTKSIKNVVIYKYNYNGGFYYLPPMKKYYKYTLVLDLDETLVYLMPNNIYLTEDGKISETRHTLIFRPGLIDFLKKMKTIYELVIFSFGTLEYVDNVIKIIEKNEKFFEHVLYRQHATINNGEYIKDLSLLGRNLKNILIVDDISQVFKLQEKNGICIKAFYGDIVGDRNTLKILGKILEKVRFDADEDGDIRKSLEKQKNIILTNITNNSD